MKKYKEEDVVRFTLRLPIDLHTKFKTKMASERKVMTDVVIDLITEYLDKAEYFENKKRRNKEIKKS